MDIAFVSCAAVTTPSVNLRTELEAKSNAYEVQESYGCELPSDHGGWHYAIADTLDPDSTPEGDDWWLRWNNDHDATLEIKAMCSAAHDDGATCEGDGICMLFDGHPGPHTDECASRWLVS